MEQLLKFECISIQGRKILNKIVFTLKEIIENPQHIMLFPIPEAPEELNNKCPACNSDDLNIYFPYYRPLENMGKILLRYPRICNTCRAKFEDVYEVKKREFVKSEILENKFPFITLIDQSTFSERMEE
jgi:hypothetical protein